jgi:hypothetical protein
MSLLQSRNVMVDDQCIIGVRGAAGGCKSRKVAHPLPEAKIPERNTPEARRKGSVKRSARGLLN